MLDNSAPEPDIEMGDSASSLFESPPSPPSLTLTGRPKQHYRLPKRYIDVPPEGPAPITPAITPAASPTPSMSQNIIQHVQDSLWTGLNRFQLLREYPYWPSHDPDAFVPLEDLLDYHDIEGTDREANSSSVGDQPPWPFPNMSIYRLMEWATTGSSQKSQIEVNRLANDVIGAPDFNATDLAGFNARREYRRFDLSDSPKENHPFLGDGWHETSVNISIPTGKRDPVGAGQTFTVSNLHRQSLLEVMKSALTDATARYFHFSPFKRIWKMSSGLEQRCFDEVYTSDAFLNANEKLQSQQNEPGCELEKVVLGLMFWSDGTQLANFRTVKAWPLYMYFANLSKYLHGKPGSGVSHHVAYIPSVSVRFATTTRARIK